MGFNRTLSPINLGQRCLGKLKVDVHVAKKDEGQDPFVPIWSVGGQLEPLPQDHLTHEILGFLTIGLPGFVRLTGLVVNFRRLRAIDAGHPDPQLRLVVGDDLDRIPI